nr:hypothetical protein [Tanacetum cinerariifolium]
WRRMVVLDLPQLCPVRWILDGIRASSFISKRNIDYLEQQWNADMVRESRICNWALACIFGWQA